MGSRAGGLEAEALQEHHREAGAVVGIGGITEIEAIHGVRAEVLPYRGAPR